MRPDTDTLLHTLLDAAERVQLITSAVALSPDRGRYLGVGASGDRTLVADKLAEEELMKSLLPLGGVKVLSEEAGNRGDNKAPVTAVLDPLDGSSNYSRGIPFYCTSAAAATGTTTEGVYLAVVRNLITGDVYAAQKGKGATKNGRKISASRTTDPKASVVDVDLSGGSREMVERLVPLLTSIKRQVHQGANALELCLLAEGKIDAFVDLRGKMRVTDFAAAYLIASEAGCILTGPGGEDLAVPLDLKERFNYIVAGNRSLHSKLVRLCGPPGPRRRP